MNIEKDFFFKLSKHTFKSSYLSKIDCNKMLIGLRSGAYHLIIIIIIFFIHTLGIPIELQ